MTVMALHLAIFGLLPILCHHTLAQSYPITCDPAEEACLEYPEGCRSLYTSLGNRQETTCRYLATWRPVSGGYEIELAGQIGGNKGYVALGFSEDENIGDDFVVGCYKNPDSEDVQIQASYNLPRPSQENQFIFSDILKEGDPVSGMTIDKNYKGGYYRNFKAVGGKWDAAIVECRFKLLTSSSAVRSEDREKMRLLLDKDDPEVHLLALLSTGIPKLNQGFGRPTWVKPMRKQPLSVKGKAQPQVYGLAKAHGCLMVLAWILCASVAIILTRYYKLQWPSHKLGKEDAWFQVHRGLMIACVILTTLSFILIFIDLRGYSGLSSFPKLLHPILGIIVTILALLNPFISLCRCRPDHKDRPWFNWIHWLVGTIAYVLAIFNMFLGLRMNRAGALNTIDFHIWILIFFVLFQFIIEITLEIHTLYHWKRNKKRWRKFHADMIDYQQAKAAMLQPRARPEEPRPAGFCLRTFLLILHAVVAAAVAFILFIVIIVY